MRIIPTIAGALLLAACGSQTLEGASTTEPIVDMETAAADSEKQPNFLIVVADDLGWSDVGAFGGEIKTPTLDGLAERGTMMTSFYVAPTCSPTRSMLMTGLNNHSAGVGAMTGIAAPNQNTRNYAAQLHDDVVTLAEVLKSNGYQTMMSGKWHLAVDEDQQPQNRGFDRSFTLLQGGASHFADRQSLNPIEAPEYLEDGEHIELPEDFYSSISYTDKILEYLGDRDADAPFLAYLAYTAPHDPIQVPDDWLDRYDGAYDMGPVAVRQARFERQKAEGLVPEDTQLWEAPNFPPWLPLHAAPWETRSEEQREIDTRPMEIYASMVELMDEQLARVINYLDEAGELDNTYIVFFSDNGASSVAPLIYPGNTKEWVNANWDRTPANIGKAGTFGVMGREWANTSNTPLRLFKGSMGDGGIRSPMIVTGPSLPAGNKTNALAHVMDIAPTFYDLAGVDSETDPAFDGKLEMQGVSLLPVLREESDEVREAFQTELFNGLAVRDGTWKLVNIPRPAGSGAWELYNMTTDMGETVNVADQFPEIVARMSASYDEYAEANGVIPPDPPPSQSLRNLYPYVCDDACEAAFERFMSMPPPNAPPPGQGAPTPPAE